jgi:hypothetical protein
MKHLKTIGLAMIAAAAMAALAGVGSAHATVLCTAADTPACATLNTYPAGTKLHFSAPSGTSTSLTSGSNTISTCTGIKLQGKTTSKGSSGKAIELQIEELTWSGCSQTTDTVALGSLSIEWIKGTHEAKIVGSGTQWTLGIFNTSCTYGTSAGVQLGTLSSGETPTLKISSSIPRVAGGFLCPSSAVLETELVVTEPHALFATDSKLEEGILCKSTTTPCVDAYGEATTIDADLNGSAVFESGGTPVATCTGGTIKGKTKNAGSNTEAVTADIEALTWSGCSQTTTTVAKGSLEIERIEGTENGTVLGKDTQITLGISGTSCTYGFGEESDLGALTGKEAPALDIDTDIPKIAGGFLCPASVRFKAEYKLTEPTPLYVEGTKEWILCKSTTTPCTSPHNKETTVDADLTGSFTFQTGSTTIATCTGSTIKGNVPSVSGAEAVVVPLQELTWSGCSQTTHTLTLGELEIERIEGTENGTVTGRKTEWTFGIYGVSCSYGFGEGTDLGTLMGGAEATLSINATISKTAGGFLCPSSAVWKASYQFTQPAPLYFEPV